MEAIQKEIYQEIVIIFNKCITKNLNYKVLYDQCRLYILDKNDSQKDKVMIDFSSSYNFSKDKISAYLFLWSDKVMRYKLNLNDSEEIEISYLFNLIRLNSEKDLLIDLQEIISGIS